MLITPRKTKFRKYFRPRGLPRPTFKPNKLRVLNCFALILKESGYLEGRQVEAARQNIRRKIKREGRLEVLVSPEVPITKKPSAVRMGKGKGKVNQWITPLPAGRVIFKLYGISKKEGMPALQSGAKKISLNLKVREL